MPLLHVDEVYPKENVYPMLVNFQNGYVSDNFSSEVCVLSENENGKRTVTTDVCDMIYTGEETEDELGKTFILTRNRKTGKVRLIEVDNVELKPVIKVDLDTTQAMNTSNLELSRKFGSKKHKKIVEQREKLKVNVDTVTEQMKDVSQTISVDQLDLSAYSKNDSEEFYVPKIDRETKNLHEVYKYTDILDETEYETIHKEIVDSDYKTTLTPIISNLITNDFTAKQLVLAVFANALITFYTILSKDIGRKSFVACTHSGTINKIILSKFVTYVQGRRNRSPQYRDKALCHAMVFILLINNYKLDFEDLANYLKIAVRFIINKVAITGATIVNSGSRKIAQLKFPLNKPKLKRQSR